MSKSKLLLIVLAAGCITGGLFPNGVKGDAACGPGVSCLPTTHGYRNYDCREDIAGDGTPYCSEPEQAPGVATCRFWGGDQCHLNGFAGVEAAGCESFNWSPPCNPSEEKRYIGCCPSSGGGDDTCSGNTAPPNTAST